MKRPTGSKLPLAFRCAAAFALPWIDEPAGEPAIRGSVIHAFLENAANHGLEQALEMAPAEARSFLSNINVAAIGRDLQILPEAAFTIDWRRRTARYLGSGLGRVYPDLGPTEFPLTTDLLGVAPGVVKVSDYKTGRTRYPRPKDFEQTMAGALAASWAYQVDEAIVQLTYVDKFGEVFHCSDRVDSWALDEFADTLERVMDEVTRAQGEAARGALVDVTPGDHCVDLYCPAFKSCPHKSGLVRHMPEHVGEIQRPGYLAPERLARTWKQANEAIKILEAVTEEIRRLSFREPIDLGDGWELGPVERNVETVDPAVTRAVLDELLGPGYGDKALTLETTKAAVERVASEWRNERGGKYPDGKRIVMESRAKRDGLLDRILDAIRKRDGAKVTTNTIPTVHRRKELP